MVDGNVSDGVDVILRERYVVELRKPMVQKDERAVIIKRLMVDKGWSGRELSRQLGFKRSTVEDWLLWDDPRVKELRAAGYSDTEIYKVLRGNRLKVKGAKKVMGADIVNDRLDTMAGQIKTMISQKEFNDHTEDAIKGVVNECNRFSALIIRDRNGHTVRKVIPHKSGVKSGVKKNKGKV